MQVFFIRHGKLIGREYFLLDGTEGESDEDVLQEFLTQFYDERRAHSHAKCCCRMKCREAMVIEQWLQQKRSTKVTLQVPQRGQKTRTGGDGDDQCGRYAGHAAPAVGG